MAKRARDSKGRFIADDPNTPENEAYVQDKNNILTFIKEYYVWIILWFFITIFIIIMLPWNK